MKRTLMTAALVVALVPSLALTGEITPPPTVLEAQAIIDNAETVSAYVAATGSSEGRVVRNYVNMILPNGTKVLAGCWIENYGLATCVGFTHRLSPKK